VNNKTKSRIILEAWAKLFIFYNVTLLILGVCSVSWLSQTLYLRGVSGREIILNCVEAGIVFNACFCIGPASEILTSLIFKTAWKNSLRNTLFGLGLSAAVIFVVITAVSAGWFMSASFH
jgi:hypothetical protein